LPARRPPVDKRDIHLARPGYRAAITKMATGCPVCPGCGHPGSRNGALAYSQPYSIAVAAEACVALATAEAAANSDRPIRIAKMIFRVIFMAGLRWGRVPIITVNPRHSPRLVTRAAEA
jgi:hypothetical protein